MQKQLHLVLLLISFFLGIRANAQSEKGFSFQGYARDFEGAALSSQTITVRFSIYPQGSSTEFEETQSATTDPYGVFQLVIGFTKPSEFAKIDFTANKYWLKVETKAYSSDFVEISNTELLSVPYAKSAENGVPAGTILPFGGPRSKIPVGYLACDGSNHNSSQYPNLYKAIGNGWGGNSSSFNVPDLRGMFLRGVNEGAGFDPDAGSRTAQTAGGNTGDNVGSRQHYEVQSHNHSGNTSVNGAHSHRIDIDTDPGWNGHIPQGSDRGINTHYNTPTAGDHSHSLNINATGGNETRPKNAYVLYIIKY